MGQIAIAAPFLLLAPTRAFLAAHPEVSGVVFWPESGQPDPDERSGLFIPSAFTWRLPIPPPKTVVLIDGPGAITARMLAVALIQRVRSIVYWNVDDWSRRAVWSLAAAKLLDRLALHCSRAGGFVGPLCLKLLQIRYRRVFRRLLQATHPVGPWAEYAPNVERRGIVLACPTLVAGGAERQIVNTALALRARAIGPITVLVARLHSPTGNDFFLPPLRDAGIEVREVRAASNLSRWIEAQALSQKQQGRAVLQVLKRLPRALAQDIADLCSELSALRPAVVHCWLDYSNVRAGLAAACCGVPRIILSGRNVGPQHFPNIHEPFMHSAYLALIGRAGVELTNNSHAGARDYAAWLGVTESRIRVVYNGIDLDTLTRASETDIRAFRADVGISSDAAVVGGLFRFSAEKRPLLWLEVAAHILSREPKIEFLLFGAGPLATAMQGFIDARGLGSRIRLSPPTPDNALAISALDVLLLTSQWEGTPNVAIEAQALGTAVVVAGGGGAAEALLHGKTGCFVEQASIEMIADAVMDLLQDPQRRARFAAAGPAFAHTRFDMARMVTETIQIYRLKADAGQVGP
jgi:glycosyltransferase involved in cell wall biosynthesis